MEYIALVDENDIIIGYDEKLKVHEEGALHRAFSVLIYDRNGNMLIQQRSSKKYHSPSLWTNSCCSHQIPSDNDIVASAKRRVFEELGITGLRLKEVDIIQYKCTFDNGLTENEIDHIFVAEYEGEVDFNRDEIDDIKWIGKEELMKWINNKPEEFTYWFKVLMSSESINKRN